MRACVQARKCMYVYVVVVADACLAGFGVHLSRERSLRRGLPGFPGDMSKVYLCGVKSSLSRGFPGFPGVTCQRYVRCVFVFRVPQASHVQDMFDVPLSCEEIFVAGLAGFPKRHTSKVCLMCFCRVKRCLSRLSRFPRRHMSKDVWCTCFV